MIHRTNMESHGRRPANKRQKSFSCYAEYRGWHLIGEEKCLSSSWTSAQQSIGLHGAVVRLREYIFRKVAVAGGTLRDQEMARAGVM